MLPDLYAEDPDFYRNMRIQDLAQGIHKLIRQHQPADVAAFEVLPEMTTSPHQPGSVRSKREVEPWRRSTAVARFREYDPALSAVRSAVDARREDHATESGRALPMPMLCSIGQHYPGFETDIHGAKRE